LGFFLRQIFSGVKHQAFSVGAIPAGGTRFAFSSAKARAQTKPPSGLFEKLSAFL